MQALDPGLIRLVAARYQRMQGLTIMASAFWLLLNAAGFFLISEEWQALPFGAVLAVYLWSRLTWMKRRIERHYADRFGRTGPPVFRNDLGLMFSMAIAYHQILRDLFHAPDYLRVALVATALCAYPVWIAIRDFSYRSHWLLLVIAGIGVSVQIPWVAPGNEAAFMWARDANLAVGLALFAVGALDHLLLVRALGGGSHQASAVEDVPSARPPA
jgi:hypothetical protein